MSGTLPGSAWSSCSTSAPSGISLKPSSAMLPTAASASRTLHAPSAPAAAFSMLRRSMRFLLGPVFYGWVFVAVAFVTMAIGVNARGAFSLLFPPVVDTFARRRDFAMSVAFAGVGVGSIVLFPLLQRCMDAAGWRAASVALGVIVLVVLAPLNLLVRTRPQEIGLHPDGDPTPPRLAAPNAP